MMKRNYSKPELEIYFYTAEEGFAHSVRLYKDYVLIEGTDRSTLRAAEEVTEYTDNQGEYTTGEWEL